MAWLYIWLSVTIVALMLEFITNEMITIWFAGGGLVSMILAACKLDWYITLPVFLVVSFVLLLCFRKAVIKYLDKNKTFTNADAVIGKEFRLITPIGFNSPGTIKINDVIWNVICQDGFAEVAEGSLVKVLEIKGNKYIVEEVI